jgi:hypothetical protein
MVGSYKQVKGELGFSDFQVRSDEAIRRHWELVFCAFSFCWWAYTRRHGDDDTAITDAAPETHPVPAAEEEVGGKRRSRKGAPSSSSEFMAGSPAAAGAQLVGPVGYAAALLASVVEGAPAATTASLA